MEDIRTVITTIPSLDTVIVESQGKRYIADELAIREIQHRVADGRLDKREVRVFDVDKKGKEYEMIWREDGKFKNEFTCNILSANTDATFELIRLMKKKQK